MEKGKLKVIYWFAYYNTDSPSVRYRAKYPLEYIKRKHGIRSYLVIPSYRLKDIIYFLRVYINAFFFQKRDSLIFIQRVNSQSVYSFLLKLLVTVKAQNSVYDLDDADYLDLDPKTIYAFVSKCKSVSAGSKKIQLHLTPFNQNIHHVTSPTVDLNIIKTAKNKTLNIGWIGDYGGDHKMALEQLLFPALEQVNFSFKLSILGVKTENEKAVILQKFNKITNANLYIPLSINWNDELCIQKELAKLDIGIATLLNSELHLSKSGIKAKQYMNNGIPVLSVDLPENNRYVIHGYNGYFIQNTTDIIIYLNKLNEMTLEEYMLLSKNARSTIENFNHEYYLSNLIKIKNSITS